MEERGGVEEWKKKEEWKNGRQEDWKKRWKNGRKDGRMEEWKDAVFQSSTLPSIQSSTLPSIQSSPFHPSSLPLNKPIAKCNQKTIKGVYDAKHN